MNTRVQRITESLRHSFRTTGPWDIASCHARDGSQLVLLSSSQYGAVVDIGRDAFRLLAWHRKNPANRASLFREYSNVTGDEDLCCADIEQALAHLMLQLG